MDQKTGFSASLSAYHSMPRKKRAHTGNLGEAAKKKARPESDDEAEITSSSLMEQSQPSFDWETGNIEDACDGGAPADIETESILSILSEDEDVPTSDAATLNAFLKKAVSGMEEIVKRGKDAAVKGLKATYAVKVGQGQSRRTENRKKQISVAALREGIQGNNQITNWFQKKPPAHERNTTIDSSSVSVYRALSTSVETESGESSPEEDELVSLPPSTRASTRAPSPIGSFNSGNGPKPDIMRTPSFEQVAPESQPDMDETITSIVDYDDEQSDRLQVPEKGLFEPPPSIDAARLALAAIKLVLKPHRNIGAGYKDPRIDLLMRGQLNLMKLFLWRYIDSNDGWIASSLQVAHAAERGPWLAKQLRMWCRAYISNRECLPINVYGHWNVSLLEDEDLAQEIHMHLQGIGKYVKAMDIVHFLDTPEMKARLKLKKTISLATAQRWMRVMDYRWTKNPHGQFVDGHEREDVVEYCQLVFLPFWENAEPSIRS